MRCTGGGVKCMFLLNGLRIKYWLHRQDKNRLTENSRAGIMVCTGCEAFPSRVIISSVLHVIGREKAVLLLLQISRHYIPERSATCILYQARSMQAFAKQLCKHPLLPH